MQALTIKARGRLSEQCLQHELFNYSDLLIHVKNLPYGRLATRDDYIFTLDRAYGTCSSKHAFLKQVAMEQGWDHILLLLVLYKMNAHNTPGISKVLTKSTLKYIPEAHCVLYDNHVKEFYDCTLPSSDFNDLIPDTLLTEMIVPEQTLDYKVEWHKNQLETWCKKEGNNFEDIWKTRETCIAAIA